MAQDKPFPNLGGLTYSEDVFFRLFDDLLGVGVVGATDYQVIQNHLGANMSVDVQPGSAYVMFTSVLGGKRRTRLPAQSNSGTPGTPNSADNWLTTFVAADATNPRIDRVVLTVRDTAIDGSGASDSALRVIAGTPTAGATLANLNGAAAIPANSTLLANVLVPAAATTVITANIGDVRTFARIGSGNLQAGTKITTSSFAGGPPASPGDGDIWVATGVTAGGGERWMFQYDAAWVGDANKWKFIGGPPIVVNGSGGTFNGTSTNTLLVATGNLPRGGAYVIAGQLYGIVSAGGAGTYELLYFVAGASVGNYGQIAQSASLSFAIGGTPEPFAVPANNPVGIGYWANNGGSIGTYGFAVTPVRIA